MDKIVLGANTMTFLLALVPVFKSCPPCPICMPKYAAIFAFFGLKLADYSQYLIPAMLVCMVITLASMCYQIRRKQLSWHPLGLASTSCGLLITFKYLISVPWLTYVMMFGLFSALIWHYHNINNSKQNDCCCSTHSPKTNELQCS